MPEKTLAIRVDEALYRRVRVRLTQKGCTLKDYITSLILEDLEASETESPQKAPYRVEELIEALKILGVSFEEKDEKED